MKLEERIVEHPQIHQVATGWQNYSLFRLALEVLWLFGLPAPKSIGCIEEKIVEVPQTVVQTVDRHVPKIQVQEIATGWHLQNGAWLDLQSTSSGIVSAPLQGEAHSEDRFLLCNGRVLAQWQAVTVGKGATGCWP